MSPDIAQEIAEERVEGRATAIADLSPRETEILRMLASGMTSDEIAAGLCLSVKTVQNNHYQIKAKLGARTDAHLVWVAIEAGLVRR